MAFDPEQIRRIQPVARWVVFGLVVLGFAGVLTGQCSLDRNTARAYPSRALPPDVEPVLLPPPEVDDEYLPCDDCHEDEIVKVEPRELDDHPEVELDHGDLWCLDCHAVEQHEQLQISNNRLTSFEESWRLCTRCHREKLPDWRAGVHGKRTGQWLGSKEYRTCVACHRPHSPNTGQLEPKPRPPRASEIHLSAIAAQEEAPRDED